MATEEKVNILDEFKVKHEKTEIDTVGMCRVPWYSSSHISEL